LEKRFGLSKQLEKYWTPRRHRTQAASIESARLLWQIDGAHGSLRRGAQLEETGKIGSKPVLLLATRNVMLTKNVKERIQKIAILTQLPAYFKAKHEKGVGTPFPPHYTSARDSHQALPKHCSPQRMGTEN